MFYPFKFIPLYKDYIWGGRNLERFGRILPEGNVAESWELSCHPEGLSIISNGELAGKSLYDVIKKFGRQIIGFSLSEKFIKEFPLLIKLIDANKKLSIQVHPYDDYAFEHENGGQGKNEAWYVIDAKPGSSIVYDLQPGLDGAKLIQSIQSGQVEKHLRRLEVFPGDVIDIPAGLVHAIGEGIIIAEIQQSSNSTYRLYDYDRVDKNGNKRELHIEKATDVIDFDSDGRDGKAKGLEIRLDGDGTKTIKIANKHFSYEIYEITGKIQENADGSKFYIYICIEGCGRINYGKGNMTVSPGETIMIPAWMGTYSIEGNMTLIKAYVPDIEKDIVSVLAAAGYSENQIYSSVKGLKR